MRRIISASTRARSATPFGGQVQRRHPVIPVDPRADEESPLGQGIDGGAHRRFADGESMGDP